VNQTGNADPRKEASLTDFEVAHFGPLLSIESEWYGKKGNPKR
jgi:hypothetical protein